MDMYEFIIDCAISPTAKKYSYPFISQGPDRCVVVVAGVPLFFIKGGCPDGVFSRFSGKCVEALANKFRTSPPPADRPFLSALHSDRGNTAIILNL
jgi:hypothetical protein